MNFSQRMGIEPATKPIQVDSMDSALRNSLWNVFQLTILDPLATSWEYEEKSRSRACATLFEVLWHGFYKLALTAMPPYADSARGQVHLRYFDVELTPWNKVYDFIEFIANCKGLMDNAKQFAGACNVILEREFSPYRFVGRTVCKISSNAEIQAIEAAASADTTLLSPVATHIKQALKLLSDRKNPDYRNSMKESISGVEAICRIIAQNERASLADALKTIQAKANLPGSLRSGFGALFGYTCDEHGIRHCLMDNQVPEAEDAMFLLVACSGFVNYLTEKARKHGLLPT